ncbi:hypothetical protein TREMEDRAFT_61082 [Tremella mesenterica DSM 1558]|uniref:uncharacterized protein n=1 Tax=Tremella mesenterica (strain ATCC 24925 / CBS 8224 / DSM 1558 / NBRC 9311 / NRRL Y-6157 / RJB 2259-6 / UBC 559-6) TaxID=578456 RepID=UPI0003F49F7F|nr:uncharacterized protein TREMEDRAFT_61082 [Tremella mesenterica DSM 1558]EIW70578.1 hypothetical protein TREMEDRAFT_61082 [Tremella mesenterica DSM 1558]
MLLGLLTFLILGPEALASPVEQKRGVVYSLDGVSVTTYYDGLWQTDGDVCAATWGAGWSANQNTGIPTCEWDIAVGAPSLAELGTNQVVAMNADWLKSDLSAYCGKELIDRVQFMKPDGSVFQFSGGPLILWDACAACASAPIVDLSAPAWRELTGAGGDQCGNLGTYSVQVLDNQIWPAVEGTTWAGPDGKGVPSTAVSTTLPVVTSIPAVPVPSTASGVCQMGTNQCVGQMLQICNYKREWGKKVIFRILQQVEWFVWELNDECWVTTATCAGSCIMDGPSAKCA